MSNKILVTIKKLIPRRLFTALQPPYHFLLSALAAAFCRFPSERMLVIGVTGTTGKTTCVYLIAKALEACGIKTGYTSTAMFNDGQREWLNDKKMTMAGRFFTQRMLRRMFKNGCRAAVVETTSQGIVQFRHRFINYDILVFTGLYPEHIEAHGGFESYRAAKGRLFAHLKSCRPKYLDRDRRVADKGVSGLKKTELDRFPKTIIANGNDANAQYFLDFWAERKLAAVNADLGSQAFGKNVALLRYGEVAADATGVSFVYNRVKARLGLLGAFNADNAMTAFAVGQALGLEAPTIATALAGLKGEAGRLERIDEGQDFTVIVDYAFEPGALSKLYEAVRSIPHGRIVHVLGSAGGGRDAARRPVLGGIAGREADLVIVTNEDPYDEDPMIIMKQVAYGAEKAGKTTDQGLRIVPDRREAIKLALGSARAGDLVLITGKGSEQGICVANGEIIPWDDRAVVRGLLQNKI